MSLRTVRILAAILALLGAALLALDAYVKATGAGLACPDWPLCFGRLIPEDFSYGVAQEVIYRYLAGLVGIITLVLAFGLYKNSKHFPRLSTLANALLILLAIYIMLDGLTVWLTLNPLIVTLHLLFGTLFLQATAMFATESMDGNRSWVANTSFDSAGVLFALFYLLLLAQIALGGYVSSSGAALACPGLVYCTDVLLPADAISPQVMQMLHRGLAAIVFVFAIGLSCVAFKIDTARTRKLVYSLPALLMVQVVVGILDVHFRVRPDIAVTHLMIAQGLLFVSALLWRSFDERICFFAVRS